MITGRRVFIETGLKFAVVGAIAGAGILSGCSKSDDKEVSPPEDLMQEHGLLNRVLLIYDACILHLLNNSQFPVDALGRAAAIIRQFVEDYHEKQEEDYLFPRFRKANQLTDLVAVLLQQHQAGRTITDQITTLCKQPNWQEPDHQKMIGLLSDFNRMYRPHEAREDTILFPAFRKIVSRHEYDSLGEEFEKNEQLLFGKDGFEVMVEKVAGIEKALNIYDLAQFTPTV